MRVILLLILLAGGARAEPATPAEVAAFTGADANRDGVLDRAEFRSFVRAMAQAGQPTARQIVAFGAYGFAFARVDRNRDGRATPDEMRRADSAHRAGQ